MLDEPIPTLAVMAFSRIATLVAMSHLPGWRRSPAVAKVMLSLALTVLTAPVWLETSPPASGHTSLGSGIFAEAALGALFGVTGAILLESFAVGAQLLGVQAGFSYASTIDPGSETDSGVLPVMAQLTGALLFFALGMDTVLIGALAQSFERYPLGEPAVGWMHLHFLIDLSAQMWVFGLRIALPIIGLLALTDLALALVGRLQANLQLLTVAFPAKMLLAVVALSMMARTYGPLLQQQAERLVANWPG